MYVQCVECVELSDFLIPMDVCTYVCTGTYVCTYENVYVPSNCVKCVELSDFLIPMHVCTGTYVHMKMCTYLQMIEV